MGHFFCGLSQMFFGSAKRRSAKWRETFFCPADSRLKAKRSARHKASCNWADLSTQKRTSGGSSETEVSELTVRPMGPSLASRAVTTVMPVVKQPIIWRKSAPVIFLLIGSEKQNLRTGSTKN